jgi:biotin synthase-related radical SAM superfamily protein
MPLKHGEGYNQKARESQQPKEFFGRVTWAESELSSMLEDAKESLKRIRQGLAAKGESL